MMLEFKALNDVVCELGESPVYDDRRQALWYCDIVKRLLIRYSLSDETTRSWSFDSDVGSLGLARSGRVVVALRHEVGLFDPDSGDWRRIAEIEPGRAETRANDGKVGPDGAFWVGTMDDRDVAVKEPLGSLYRVDHERGGEEDRWADHLERPRFFAGRDGDVPLRLARQMDRSLGLRREDRRHRVAPPHSRSRRRDREAGRRGNRCGGLLLERRRLRGPAEPLLARRQAACRAIRCRSPRRRCRASAERT